MSLMNPTSNNTMGAHINALFTPRPPPEFKPQYPAQVEDPSACQDDPGPGRALPDFAPSEESTEDPDEPFPCESLLVEVLKDSPHVQVGKKRGLPYTGLSAFLSTLEAPEEYEEVMAEFNPIEQRKERRVRIAEERHERAKTVLPRPAALTSLAPPVCRRFPGGELTVEGCNLCGENVSAFTWFRTDVGAWVARADGEDCPGVVAEGAAGLRQGSCGERGQGGQAPRNWPVLEWCRGNSRLWVCSSGSAHGAIGVGAQQRTGRFLPGARRGHRRGGRGGGVAFLAERDRDAGCVMPVIAPGGGGEPAGVEPLGVHVRVGRVQVVVRGPPLVPHG